MFQKRSKLRVFWDGFQYVAHHNNTNVLGLGPTPGAAIRDWQWWWNVPY